MKLATVKQKKLKIRHEILALEVVRKNLDLILIMQLREMNLGFESEDLDLFKFIFSEVIEKIIDQKEIALFELTKLEKNKKWRN